MYNDYDIGDLVRLDVEITISGTYVDPNYLALFVTDPNDDVFTFIYGTTGTFIRDGLGKFHLDYYLRYPGQYKYRFYSSGTAWGAEVQRLVVKRD